MPIWIIGAFILFAFLVIFLNTPGMRDVAGLYSFAKGRQDRPPIEAPIDATPLRKYKNYFSALFCLTVTFILSYFAYSARLYFFYLLAAVFLALAFTNFKKKPSIGPPHIGKDSVYHPDQKYLRIGLLLLTVGLIVFGIGIIGLVLNPGESTGYLSMVIGVGLIFLLFSFFSFRKNKEGHGISTTE